MQLKQITAILCVTQIATHTLFAPPWNNKKTQYTFHMYSADTSDSNKNGNNHTFYMWEQHRSKPKILHSGTTHKISLHDLLEGTSGYRDTSSLTAQKNKHTVTTNNNTKQLPSITSILQDKLSQKTNEHNDTSSSTQTSQHYNETHEKATRTNDEALPSLPPIEKMLSSIAFNEKIKQDNNSMPKQQLDYYVENVRCLHHSA